MYLCLSWKFVFSFQWNFAKFLGILCGFINVLQWQFFILQFLKCWPLLAATAIHYAYIACMFATAAYYSLIKYRHIQCGNSASVASKGYFVFEKIWNTQRILCVLAHNSAAFTSGNYLQQQSTNAEQFLEKANKFVVKKKLQQNLISLRLFHSLFWWFCELNLCSLPYFKLQLKNAKSR